MLKMLSYIGIFRRKFIWSNPQAMLLKGNKSLSSQEGHIWTQAKFKDVIWEVQPYHFCYWISPVLFRSHFFVRRTKSAIVILAVYVDNILLIGSDSPGLLETKRYLKRHFVTKDMGRPKYFLKIEFAHKKLYISFPAKVCSGSSRGNRFFVMQVCYHSNGRQCGFIGWW